jgi:hypothetical protein
VATSGEFNDSGMQFNWGSNFHVDVINIIIIIIIIIMQLSRSWATC